MNIRVRYAPSPTGNQHIGGVRTALFDYLFARSQNGTFILRVEDTDRTRSDDVYLKNLYDTFEWLGFKWDEGPDTGGSYGPYIQSKRLELYQKYALELVKAGRAYYCFCSAGRIEKVRTEREAAIREIAQSEDGQAHETGYDRHCRSIPAEEAARRAAAGESCTIRLKIPLGENPGEKTYTKFEDPILGKMEWKNRDINPDPILLKTDGYPTYHLAVVVDDHLMGITHAFRAQEWLPSTPLHLIIYETLGWTPPVICHLPLVVGQDGKKLSKRHGSTSIDEFRNQGYLPEALINYVAMVGCSYEEGKDIYTLEELAGRFSIEKLNKAPAAFDYKKLEWYNGQYIRMKSDDELVSLGMPHAVDAGLFGSPGQKPDAGQEKLFADAIPLVKERLSFLREIPGKLAYLFGEPPMPPKEEFFPKKIDLDGTINLLKKGRELVTVISAAANDAEAEELTKAYAEKEGLKLGDLMMPLRVAVTGARVSPPLFGSLRLLGQEKSIACVDRALAYLG